MRDTTRNVVFGVDGLIINIPFSYSFTINGTGGLRFIREELRVGDDEITRSARDLEVNGKRIENAIPRDDTSMLTSMPIVPMGDKFAVVRPGKEAVPISDLVIHNLPMIYTLGHYYLMMWWC